MTARKAIVRLELDDRLTEIAALALGRVAWTEATNQFPLAEDLLSDLAAGDWTDEDVAELLRDGER